MVMTTRPRAKVNDMTIFNLPRSLVCIDGNEPNLRLQAPYQRKLT